MNRFGDKLSGVEIHQFNKCVGFTDHDVANGFGNSNALCFLRGAFAGRDIKDKPYVCKDGVTGKVGHWKMYKGKDVVGQRSISQVSDWTRKMKLDDLMQIVEDKGLSSITVGKYYPHAYLKNFDYQLEAGQLRGSSSSNQIHIWTEGTDCADLY